MSFDKEKYRKHLKSLKLPKAQEDRIIDFVCSMMEEFALIWIELLKLIAQL